MLTFPLFTWQWLLETFLRCLPFHFISQKKLNKIFEGFLIIYFEKRLKYLRVLLSYYIPRKNQKFWKEDTSFLLYIFCKKKNNNCPMCSFLVFFFFCFFFYLNLKKKKKNNCPMCSFFVFRFFFVFVFLYI